MSSDLRTINPICTAYPGRHSVYIDGLLVVMSDEQARQARHQLDLPADFHPIGATCLLQHDTGNGMVQIPLPEGHFVVVLENPAGHRRYGVVMLSLPS